MYIKQGVFNVRLRLKRKVKVTLYIIMILLVSGMLIFEVYYSKNILKKKSVAYNKSSNINYVTYLKNNNHFNSQYLEDDYNYVASLINYFNLDFNYTYVLNENIDYILTSEVVGVLEVYDSDTKDKPLDKKPFNLVDKSTISKNGQVIKVELYNIKVDYETYNNIIQEWKKDVSPEATLKVQFKVKWQGFSKTINKELSDEYTNTFEIPISQKVININKPNVMSDKGTLYSNQTLGNSYFIVVGSTVVILLIFLIGFINLIISINKNKSKYEQKVKRILREFDRAITEENGKFEKKEDEHYIEVKEFMELMDVHDNLNEPIIYYKHSNNKCIFVVRNGTDIYDSMIKRDDYD